MSGIILTGFERFLDYKNNTTEQYVSALSLIGVKTRTIPVSFVKCVRAAREIVGKKPKQIIALGQKETQSIELEFIALNYIHSIDPDNDGSRIVRQKIVKNGPLALESNYNIIKVYNALIKSMPLKLSYFAGTYVCNCFYYSLLYQAVCKKVNTKILFLHIPSKNLKKYRKHLDTLLSYCVSSM